MFTSRRERHPVLHGGGTTAQDITVRGERKIQRQGARASPGSAGELLAPRPHPYSHLLPSSFSLQPSLEPLGSPGWILVPALCHLTGGLPGLAGTATRCVHGWPGLLRDGDGPRAHLCAEGWPGTGDPGSTSGGPLPSALDTSLPRLPLLLAGVCGSPGASGFPKTRESFLHSCPLQPTTRSYMGTVLLSSSQWCSSPSQGSSLSQALPRTA